VSGMAEVEFHGGAVLLVYVQGSSRKSLRVTAEPNHVEASSLVTRSKRPQAMRGAHEPGPALPYTGKGTSFK